MVDSYLQALSFMIDEKIVRNYATRARIRIRKKRTQVPHEKII